MTVPADSPHATSAADAPRLGFAPSADPAAGYLPRTGVPYDRDHWHKLMGGREVSAADSRLRLTIAHMESPCRCPIWAFKRTPAVQIHHDYCKQGRAGMATVFAPELGLLVGESGNLLDLPAESFAARIRGLPAAQLDAAMAAEADDADALEVRSFTADPLDAEESAFLDGTLDGRALHKDAMDGDPDAARRVILTLVRSGYVPVPESPEEALRELPQYRRAASEVEAVARRRDELTEIPHSIRGYMTHDAIWDMTPGMRIVTADAERNGVSPWAQLGTALARVSASIPTWVRLVPETGSPNGAGGANLDIYVVLSGPGGSGKSVVIKAGRTYCDGEAHGFNVGATPTGEGLNKDLLEQEEGTLDDGGKFNPSRRIWNPSFLIEEGEGENFTKMALQRDSTLLGQLRAHWGGDQAGKPTADEKRRTSIDAMWARVATLLILHPEICTTLLMQVGNGSSARFVWLPAYRTGPAKVTDDSETPFRLPRYGARHFVDGDGVAPSIGSLVPSIDRPEIFWIRQPAAMRRAMDLEGVRAYVDPTAVTEASDLEARKMHDMLQRFKLSAVLSAMDGIAQPEDVHWHVATEIVAVSHRVQQELMGAVQRVTEIKSEDKGRELALTDVTRTSHRDALTDSDVQDATAAIIATLGRKPMPRAELRDKVRSLSRATARGYTKALGQLQACGAVVDAGRGQPLRMDLTKLDS